MRHARSHAGRTSVPLDQEVCSSRVVSIRRHVRPINNIMGNGRRTSVQLSSRKKRVSPTSITGDHGLLASQSRQNPKSCRKIVYTLLKFFGHHEACFTRPISEITGRQLTTCSAALQPPFTRFLSCCRARPFRILRERVL
jgi:hypothetical protein